ncbi:hypothetical protein DV515_00015147 [Chloebia gouldiae]|uniref:Uncharacterized protein n=1 Tax=Chloebia gouldiae TaxID=44316 RepID=A0A3L8RXN8_CHLGU|nr:hypothetical protein DV515_00015147 [Chloebia gouldiae]
MSDCLGYSAEFPHHGMEAWLALAQGAQRSCGCPWIPGSVQGQAGLGAPWDSGRCPCPSQGVELGGL